MITHEGTNIFAVEKSLWLAGAGLSQKVYSVRAGEG